MSPAECFDQGVVFTAVGGLVSGLVYMFHLLIKAKDDHAETHRQSASDRQEAQAQVAELLRAVQKNGA